MNKGNKRSTNHSINLVKGIACICVIFIHLTFPGMVGEIVVKIGGFAVPFFYMVSGYYAYNQDISIIKKRLIKIIKIFIYAYLLFFTYNFSIQLINSNHVQWLISNFNIFTPVKYIVFCTIDFAIPLWYLIAMMETYVLWIIVIKHSKEKAILKTTPFLFILQIILTIYCETLNLDWFWKINFVTRALPWFLFGYFVNERSDLFSIISNRKLIIISLIGCFIACTTCIYKTPINYGCIGYIPYSISLFILAVNNPKRRLCKSLEYIGSNLSLYVYIIHPLVGNVIALFLSTFSIIDINSNVYRWCHPILGLILTLVFSLFIYSFIEASKK